MNNDGNLTSIIIALLALLTVLVAAIVWVAKYALKEITRNMKANTTATVKQAQASHESTRASKEVLVFMKALNGRLTKITQQKVDEQTVIHQTVKEVK